MTNNCEKCDNGNKEYEENHNEETEESYYATMGYDGKIQFTCKLCEASFVSQKSVVQHKNAKHGRAKVEAGFTQTKS